LIDVYDICIALAQVLANILAVRKAKFFLHPDKLPSDLTNNQAVLFKTLWEVINDSWEAMERDISFD
jgi:hypothetical protein